MSSIDRYLVKAIDAYPYNLEEAIESLDYALSGDNNNAATLCLYGRVYAEQLQAVSYTHLFILLNFC